MSAPATPEGDERRNCAHSYEVERAGLFCRKCGAVQLHTKEKFAARTAPAIPEGDERETLRATIAELRDAYREAIGVPESEHQKRRMESIATAYEAAITERDHWKALASRTAPDESVIAEVLAEMVGPGIDHVRDMAYGNNGEVRHEPGEDIYCPACWDFMLRAALSRRLGGGA